MVSACIRGRSGGMNCTYVCQDRLPAPFCQHNATYCNTHCNTLQHTARHTAAHCNSLQSTATHCNKLHHTTTAHVISCSYHSQHSRQAPQPRSLCMDFSRGKFSQNTHIYIYMYILVETKRHNAFSTAVGTWNFPG